MFKIFGRYDQAMPRKQAMLKKLKRKFFKIIVACIELHIFGGSKMTNIRFGDWLGPSCDPDVMLRKAGHHHIVW